MTLCAYMQADRALELNTAFGRGEFSEHEQVLQESEPCGRCEACALQRLAFAVEDFSECTDLDEICYRIARLRLDHVRAQARDAGADVEEATKIDDGYETWLEENPYQFWNDLCFAGRNKPH